MWQRSRHRPAPRPSAAARSIQSFGLARPSIARARVVDIPADFPEVPAAQFRDCLLEVVERLEAPVNAGKSEVRDLVEIAERSEDRQPDLVRRHLGEAPRPDRLLHPLGEYREVVFVHRSTLARPLHTADDLVPGERLGHPAALGHHQDDRLLSGESPSALRAGSPSADRDAVVGSPAVNNPAVRMTAKRTVHAITSRRSLAYPFYY